MDDWVIKMRKVNKTYYVRDRSESTIRSSVLGMFSKKESKTKIKAVRNFNLTVRRGEIMGILGKNGSGKSTLLNLIIGSIRADKGSIIETKGKMIRLALGMGFDPNLTARDNIYVNSSILGLSFKRIGLIFDDIIQFAELEDFVDIPVKFYSKGMLAKLKFSIAVNAQADIFLMDEFFGGVGDESFKKKSEDIFESTFKDGRTILLVSHSLRKVAQNCGRVLIMDKGRKKAIGPQRIIIPQYQEIARKYTRRQKRKKNQLI